MRSVHVIIIKSAYKFLRIYFALQAQQILFPKKIKEYKKYFNVDK